MMTMAPGMEGARWYHHQVDSRYPPPPHHPHGPPQHPGMHDPASIINPDHQVRKHFNRRSLLLQQLRQVVVFKGSASMHYNPSIRVQISLKFTV